MPWFSGPVAGHSAVPSAMAESAGAEPASLLREPFRGNPIDIDVDEDEGYAKLMRLPVSLAGVLLCASLAGAQETSPEDLFNHAHQAQQSGKNELAVQKYKELIQIHPEVVAAHANLWVWLVSLGRDDEAIAEYHVALTEAPSSPPLVLDLALAYYKKGDFAAAASHLAALHKENPSDVRIATLLGKCETQLGLIGQALAVLEPLEKSNGDNLDLEWALGTAMLRAGENLEGVKRIQKVADQAQKDFEKVTQENPDWIQPHVQLSALYYRLKRPADGDKERAIVDRLRDQEQKRREQAHVVSPQVAPQTVSPEIPPQ